jgi:hypothetical protein
MRNIFKKKTPAEIYQKAKFDLDCLEAACIGVTSYSDSMMDKKIKLIKAYKEAKANYIPDGKSKVVSIRGRKS